MIKDNKVVLESCTRLVLLGGGTLMPDVVEKALKIGYAIDVITSPRHASEDVGEGISLSEVLKKYPINVIVSVDINESSTVKYLKSLNKDTLFLSLGAAWIFSEEFISNVLGGRLFNLHGSRLPQNRGGGGFSWQIMMGNRFGFCLIHLVDAGVDTGSIVDFEEFIYPHECKYPIQYIDYYKKKNIRFIGRIIKRAFEKKSTFSITKQSEYFSTYWPRLNQDTSSWIDWSQSPEQIERFISAFGPPYKGALTTINGKNVRINKIHINYQDGIFHPYQSGIVYRKGDEWLCVALDGAGIVIESIVDDSTGKSCLSLISIGDRFVTTSKMLESNKNRVIYTPNRVR